MESPEELVLFPPALIELWNQWQLRCLVLISFTLQATLTILGNRRNFNTVIALRVIIWLSYLFADAVAGLALGIFSQNNPEETSHVLVLWIPLLLLHLGGPDFITAYALEDNELWLRHFLALVVQVLGAFYVFLKSWNSSSPVTYMAIPLFVAGLIKYGERTWALKSATSEEFIDLARANADADESAIIELDLRADIPPSTKKKNLIATAYSYLQVAGTVLTDEKDEGMSRKCALLVKRSHNNIQNVYDIIEIELGLLYNWFYTKFQIFYSPIGFLLRLIGSCCLITVTVAFAIFQRKNNYDKIDVILSYLLLVGAILLEIYSVFQLVLSDWMVILLCQFTGEGNKIVEAICRVKLSVDGKHWSRKIRRLNLLDYVLEKHPTWYYIPKKWDKHFYKSTEDLPLDLQGVIFKELADDSRRSVSKWSQEIEEKYGNEQLKWLFELSFSDSVLIWHIATEMLYILDSDPTDPYREKNRLRSDPGRQRSLEISKDNRELSRRISEYMMYLLVLCPTMIPGGVQDFKISAACSLVKKKFNLSSTQETKKVFYAGMLFRMFHRDSRTRNDHWGDINELWEFMDAEDQTGNGNESEDVGNRGHSRNPEEEEEDQSEDEEESEDAEESDQSQREEEDEQISDEEDEDQQFDWDYEESDQNQTENQEEDAEDEDQQFDWSFDDQDGAYRLEDQDGERDVEDQSSHQRRRRLLERLSRMKNKVLICLSKEKKNARRTLRRKSTKISKREEMNKACELADMFLSSSGGRNWTEQRRWKVIREVWLEMLFYAANQCKWEAHVQHLRRGGEFLTHVWMLMLLLGGNK